MHNESQLNLARVLSRAIMIKNIVTDNQDIVEIEKYIKEIYDIIRKDLGGKFRLPPFVDKFDSCEEAIKTSFISVFLTVRRAKCVQINIGLAELEFEIIIRHGFATGDDGQYCIDIEIHNVNEKIMQISTRYG